MKLGTSKQGFRAEKLAKLLHYLKLGFLWYVGHKGRVFEKKHGAYEKHICLFLMMIPLNLKSFDAVKTSGNDNRTTRNSVVLKIETMDLMTNYWPFSLPGFEREEEQTLKLD